MDYMESRVTRAKVVLALSVLLFVLFVVLVPVLAPQIFDGSDGYDEYEGYAELYVLAIPFGFLVLLALGSRMALTRYDLLDEQRSLGMRD